MLSPVQQKVMLEGVFERLAAYGQIDPHLLTQILPLLEFRSFRKKEKILEIGQIDPYFNLVCQGLVRKYVVIGKKEITLQLATEGHYVHSELSFFRSLPATVTIEALEPTILVGITRANMEMLFQLDPAFEHLGRLMVNDMFMRKDARYYAQLKYNTNERFLRYMEHHSEMVQRVPQKYLASYLNMKPETFSRLKHLLRKKKST